MRGGLLGAWSSIAGAALFAFACGTQLAAPPGDDPPDAAIDATEPAEPPLTEFGCGPARCTVNVHVCCLVAGDPTCAPIADGCMSKTGDAGADASEDAGPPPKPLQCTTYRLCNGTNPYGTNDCCWSESQGSSCKNDCAKDERRLCQQGDGCGQGYSCAQIAGDPLGPNVGECVPDGTGSSGGSSWGGSSGFNGSSGFP